MLDIARCFNEDAPFRARKDAVARAGEFGLGLASMRTRPFERVKLIPFTEATAHLSLQ